jgi:hypothetical protein
MEIGRVDRFKGQILFVTGYEIEGGSQDVKRYQGFLQIIPLGKDHRPTVP